ncbi:MAG: hypothetical protein HC836_44175 [Richelia sp. RM2_1_2]|nr:hypothetical protein [Richelia sp. RM2_1_2]
MSYNLFLDDFRIPADGFNILGRNEYLKLKWVVVRSHNEFVDYILKNGMPDLISFDHDLADEHYAPPQFWDEKYNQWAEKKGFKEKTGMDSAKWLVEFCMDNKVSLPNYFVHSMNSAGRANIQGLLDNYSKFEKQNDKENS